MNYITNLIVSQDPTDILGQASRLPIQEVEHFCFRLSLSQQKFFGKHVWKHSLTIGLLGLKWSTFVLVKNGAEHQKTKCQWAVMTINRNINLERALLLKGGSWIRYFADGTYSVFRHPPNGGFLKENGNITRYTHHLALNNKKDMSAR